MTQALVINIDDTARPVYVLGAGGHAKVVVATLEAAGYLVEGIYDDDPSLAGLDILGVPVLGPTTLIETTDFDSVVAVGENATRQRVVQAWSEQLRWASVIHPTAFVHASVEVGDGTVVCAQAVIHPDSVIGQHVIVGAGTTIGHDTNIHDYVHLAPGVHLAGNVRIGEGAFVGIGSSVIQGIEIGRWANVGAGSVVIHDLTDGITAVGAPARPLPYDPQRRTPLRSDYRLD